MSSTINHDQSTNSLNQAQNVLELNSIFNNIMSELNQSSGTKRDFLLKKNLPNLISNQINQIQVLQNQNREQMNNLNGNTNEMNQSQHLSNYNEVTLGNYHNSNHSNNPSQISFNKPMPQPAEILTTENTQQAIPHNSSYVEDLNR